MNICSIDNLKKIKFTIDDISSIRQTPTYRSLNVTSRLHNGLLLVEEGECVYEWGSCSVKLKKGSCIYLPYGSVHRLIILSENFSFIRLNFSISDSNKEKIIFSNEPNLICKEPDGIITDCIHKITYLFMNADNIFLRNAMLYELFDRILKISAINKHSNISNVVAYINSNYTKEIDCSVLADISFMSPAQMYRTFKKEIGCTPVEYKNKLRIDQAKIMLRNDSMSVNEISLLLGFENVSYFSKIFKKYIGCSPTLYRKKQYFIQKNGADQN